MSVNNIEIDTKAYTKIMLHVLKHIASDCYGALIGIVEHSTVRVVDAVPLFHNRVFTPQTEIALNMIEANLGKNEVIVGMYENLLIEMKNYRGTNESIGISEAIFGKKVKNPILFEITSQPISEPGSSSMRAKDMPNFNIYFYNEKNGFDYFKNYKETTENYEVIKKMIESNKLTEIVDFDDHFEDVNADWRNSFV